MMSENVPSLKDLLSEFSRTHKGLGQSLRVNLSELIIRGLRDKRWSQHKLACEAGMQDSFISRIIHGDANCTLDTAAKLLFALGMRAKISESVGTQVTFGSFKFHSGASTNDRWVTTEPIRAKQEIQVHQEEAVASRRVG